MAVQAVWAEIPCLQGIYREVLRSSRLWAEFLSDARRNNFEKYPNGDASGVRLYEGVDNGPEFVAQAVQEWNNAVGAKSVYIEPGSPWENGYCESFNARLRDECLNGEVFYSLREAKILIELWWRHNNTKRPHSALGYRPTPRETIVPIDARPIMHVWIPPCMQEDFERLRHVIGCSHETGLLMRHCSHGRGPVWRCADQVQFTNASFVLCA